MGVDPVTIAAIASTITAASAAKTALTSKPKAAPTQAPTAAEAPEIPKGDDDKEAKKRAIVARNIGAEAPQTQKLGGKPASVTRRTLLGL